VAELCTDGVLPDPTDEAPQLYEFVLQHQDSSIAEFDWADFRGGALFSRSDRHGDVEVLRRRLVASDSIHLVLDGGVLADAHPLTEPANLSSALGADRMSAIVRQAIDERRSRDLAAPSLVVLLTKADRILECGGPGRSARFCLDQAVDRVIALLPIVTNAGLTVMVCPVQVGFFGRATGRVDPATVAPEWLHQPILFTVRHHCFLEGRRQRGTEERLATEIVRGTAELTAVRSRPLAQIVHRGRITRLRAQVADAEQQQQAGSAAALAEHRFGLLGSAIEPAIAIFDQGARVSYGG
jgi:hypothetical protein